jgi:hypothetical protein
MDLQQVIIFVFVYGLVVNQTKKLFKQFVDEDSIAKGLKSQLMALPRVAMMVLMAIPEQLVMYYQEPNMSLFNRLMVSVAMYIIHFAWNGMVMKPERSYNELVWIIGTAHYALNVLGVKRTTATALIAADSVMTLALRGL